MKRNSKFNTVNVTFANIETGNHCVNADQLVNGKPFKFIIGKQEYAVTAHDVMSYIGSHKECLRFKHFNKFNEEELRSTHSCYPYYLIPDEFIINNAVEYLV